MSLRYSHAPGVSNKLAGTFFPLDQHKEAMLYYSAYYDVWNAEVDADVEGQPLMPLARELSVQIDLHPGACALTSRKLA